MFNFYYFTDWTCILDFILQLELTTIDKYPFNIRLVNIRTDVDSSIKYMIYYYHNVNIYKINNYHTFFLYK
jgi:hypothetical protein